jgi:hypothetical protein
MGGPLGWDHARVDKEVDRYGAGVAAERLAEAGDGHPSGP